MADGQVVARYVEAPHVRFFTSLEQVCMHHRLELEDLETLGPRQILIVEDDADTRDSLALLLAEEGYAVVTAKDGSEALEHLKRAARPDLIILDLMMPILDGFEFRAAQRAVGGEVATIPVVVMSATLHTISSSRAFKAMRADAAVQKPFDAKDLLKIVARLLR